MKRVSPLVWVLLCALALLSALTACADVLTDPAGDIEQQYLFEVEHVNFAWGFYWAGVVIEGDGNVYAYDRRDEEWDRMSSTMFTREELEEKFAPGRRLIGQVDAGTLQRQYARIRDVGVDFETPVPVCADAGVLTYRAWRYDPTDGSYQPLTLREEGDSLVRNTSDAAEALAEWLRELIPTLDDAPVSPFTEGVCTP